MTSSWWLREWAEQHEAEEAAKKATKQLRREQKFKRKLKRSNGFGLVRPIPVPTYADWSVEAFYEVTRDYDPTLYGRPSGSEWPRTDEDAQRG